MADYRAGLIRHCGGAPSATQSALIDRAAVLHLRLTLLDKLTLNQPMTEPDSRHYIALSDSLLRLLTQLGETTSAVSLVPAA